MLKNLFFLLIAVATLSTTTSCKKEGCTDPTSDNYDADAKEDDGSCIPARDKFLGSYNASTSCDGDTYSYVMGIVTGTTGPDKVIISNILDYGENVIASISGSTITLEPTTFYYGTLNGSGQLIGSELTLNMTYSEEGYGDTSCLMTATKM